MSRAFPVDMRHFADKTVVLVTAGASHSAAVTECGRMYLWGDTNILQEAEGTYLPKFNANKRTPLPVHMPLFGGARVGLWNGRARGHILALAMATHSRLGIHSSAAFTDDILYRIAHTDTICLDALGQCLRTLMGFRQ